MKSLIVIDMNSVRSQRQVGELIEEAGNLCYAKIHYLDPEMQTFLWASCNIVNERLTLMKETLKSVVTIVRNRGIFGHSLWNFSF